MHPNMSHSKQISLYSPRATRLYLNRAERRAFETKANSQTRDIKCLALILYYTGCRISEALALRLCDLQIEDGCIAIKSLKKRNRSHVRQVPVPPEFLDELLRHYSSLPIEQRLIPVARSTAWVYIKGVMNEAGIQGDQACPKGLRHSFGVHCAFSNVAMPLCQKWMGHADIKTTAIYYQIVGKEEREMASRLWD